MVILTIKDSKVYSKAMKLNLYSEITIFTLLAV
jgi:hypothetical protein